MRLQQYIIEEIKDEPEKTIELIKKNCGPFLKELKQTGRKQFLYRGHNYASGTITKKKVRQDRRPKDMDELTSDYLDELFKKKFGWCARSKGVFATADINETYEYGKPFLFFPIGKYKYIWSPVVIDLYTKIDNKELSLEDIEEEKDMFEIEHEEDVNYSLLKFFPELTFEEFIKQKEDSIKEDLKDLVSSYINKNLKQAIDFKGEITFQCKEYYLVLESLEDVLTHEFF